FVSQHFGDPPLKYLEELPRGEWVTERREEFAEAKKNGPIYIGVVRVQETNQIVGFLHGGEVRKKKDFEGIEEIEAGHRTLELWTISVHLDFLEYKLGSMLLNDFNAFVRETSMGKPTVLVLITFECNKRSQRFYEKNGMRMAKRFTKNYFNLTIPVLCFLSQV
ncbi:hypothetical protein HDU67_002985, partial [Dinochytrium kinnereticum]